MTKSLPPIYSGATPEQVAADLAPLVDFQDEGLSLDALEQMISARLLPHLMRYDRPQFQSMFNAFLSNEGKLGARVALAYNQGVTNWQVSPGGAMLEELCGRALCKLFGLAPDADATFMYSGTYGNQQALYMALHRHAEREGFDLAQKGIIGFQSPEKLAILVPEGAHFSLNHGVRMLGLGEQCLVKIPLDTGGRIDMKALKRIVREVQSTREIVCLVATAGATSTGAVDPIAGMVDLCAEIGAWLHVDGAYGYAYKLVPEWAHLFAGDDRADSIIWDPHKQLSAPIPSSILFVKEQSDFARMALHSHYFNQAGAVEPNPGLKSPPSTRPMSALPLVAILRGYGLNRLIQELRTPLVAIRSLANYIDALPDVALSHRPNLGILCFRVTPPHLSEQALDKLQQDIYERIMSSGVRTISITNLGGQRVLRLVVVSSQTTLADLQETVEEIRGLVHNF